MAEVKAKGAELVVVGSGQPEQAREFGERSGLSAAGARLLVDPSLDAFRLAGMRRGLHLSVKLVGDTFRALRGGHMQGLTKGDAKQLGGVLVVGAGGAIRYRHANESVGEMAPLDAALATL